jgi:hypothetical protein
MWSVLKLRAVGSLSQAVAHLTYVSLAFLNLHCRIAGRYYIEIVSDPVSLDLFQLTVHILFNAKSLFCSFNVVKQHTD